MVRVRVRVRVGVRVSGRDSVRVMILVRIGVRGRIRSGGNCPGGNCPRTISNKKQVNVCVLFWQSCSSLYTITFIPNVINSA